MLQIAAPINNLPFQLVLTSAGHVGIVPILTGTHFNVIYSYTADDSVNTVFDEGGFTVNGKEFLYSTFYVLAENDELKEWLKSENLNAPWEDVVF